MLARNGGQAQENEQGEPQLQILERATRATRSSGVSVFTAAPILVPGQSSLQVLHLAGPTRSRKNVWGKRSPGLPVFTRYPPVLWVKRGTPRAPLDVPCLQVNQLDTTKSPYFGILGAAAELSPAGCATPNT